MLPIEYCGMHNEWKKPKIIPFCNLSISPAAPCLNYAIECFDGMAAYDNSEGQITMFRPLENLNRFHAAVKRLSLQVFCISYNII